MNSKSLIQFKAKLLPTTLFSILILLGACSRDEVLKQHSTLSLKTEKNYELAYKLSNFNKKIESIRNNDISTRSFEEYSIEEGIDIVENAFNYQYAVYNQLEPISKFDTISFDFGSEIVNDSKLSDFYSLIGNSVKSLANEVGEQSFLIGIDIIPISQSGTQIDFTIYTNFGLNSLLPPPVTPPGVYPDRRATNTGSCYYPNDNNLGCPKIIQNWINEIENPPIGVGPGEQVFITNLLTIDNEFESYPLHLNNPLKAAMFAFNTSDISPGDGEVDRRSFYYFAEEQDCYPDAQESQLLCIENDDYIYYANQMRLIVGEMKAHYNRNHMFSVEMNYLHKQTTDWVICWRYWKTYMQLGNLFVGPEKEFRNIHSEQF